MVCSLFVVEKKFLSATVYWFMYDEIFFMLKAVAIAGTTGFLAKHLFNNVIEKKIKENEEEEMKAIDLIPCEGVSSTKENKGMFRFSSLGNGDGRKSKGLGKIVRFIGRLDDRKRRSGFKKKLNFADRNKVIVWEEQMKNGRRFSFHLKNRTGKNKIGKCRLSASKGSSFVSSGLGVGIMYITSAVKPEIYKLNGAVDEATIVVNDLKCKVREREIFSDLQDSSHKDYFSTSPEDTLSKDKQNLIVVSNMEGANLIETKALDPNLYDDGECASSVLTEELEQDRLEIDQLEAELEFELQKLSWCASKEPSGCKGQTSNFNELTVEHLLNATNSEHSAVRSVFPHEVVDRDRNSFHYNGVSPFELDRKLCHLLIEQQKGQILELESRLLSAEVKLTEKVAELQALKNYVHHIRNLSLQTSSDEETGEETHNVGLEIKGNQLNITYR
ncbi:hypothetical protein AQUCO_02700084v1 [Aquilegia coerulea]|uniref:Uncharacterized protein n=1 Tax=Aquilegia coerulea TaxID=218851 RepID=A0A2G5D526_AQUCA|nr:hypothetical protein AQUCO_02700084v1 [Aquilegia coerulea]